MGMFSDFWNSLKDGTFSDQIFGFNKPSEAAKAFWMPGAYQADQNARMTMLTNAENRRNIERQNQLNIEQWQRENDYNNPVNQMQRMRAAGLNPAMMYGGSGSIATSAPSPTMQGARDIAPQLGGTDDLLGKILGIARTKAEIENINASSDKLRSDIGLNESQIRVNDNSIECGKVRLQFDQRLSDAQTGFYVKQAEDIEKNWKLLDAKIDDVRANIALTDGKTEAQRLENYFNSVTMQDRIHQECARLQKLYGEIALDEQKYKQLAEMFVVDKQRAIEELNQLIAEGKFTENMRPYELLEQQNDAWVAAQELSAVTFNLNLAKEKHGRHTVVGRYVDDLLGSLGQVLGGTANYSIPTQPRSKGAKTIVKKLK